MGVWGLGFRVWGYRGLGFRVWMQGLGGILGPSIQVVDSVGRASDSGLRKFRSYLAVQVSIMDNLNRHGFLCRYIRAAIFIAS